MWHSLTSQGTDWTKGKEEAKWVLSKGVGLGEQGMATLIAADGCQVAMEAEFCYILFIFPQEKPQIEFPYDIFQLLNVGN